MSTKDPLILSSVVHDDSNEKVERTVVFGIDGSDFSQHALEWAVGNVLKPETDLIVLINVRHNEPDALAATAFGTVDYMESAYSTQLEAEEKKRAEDILKKSVAYLKSVNSKFIVKAFAMVGDPREELVLKTREVHADIIIVASRGMGAIKRALIGSTSDHLTHHSPCPVIVVKENMN